MSIEKGDLPGHPFRGNQHTGGLAEGEKHFDVPRVPATRLQAKIMEFSDRAYNDVVFRNVTYNSSPEQKAAAEKLTRDAAHLTNHYIRTGNGLNRAQQAHSDAAKAHSVAGNTITAAKHQSAVLAIKKLKVRY